ncbi:MAG: hypothetical protein CNLJKLNK_00847 [Holosporales bacterium]
MQRKIDMKNLYTLFKKTIKKNAVLCGMLVASVTSVSAFNECVTNSLGKCQSAEGALNCLKKKYPAAYNRIVELSGTKDKDNHFSSPASIPFDGFIYFDVYKSNIGVLSAPYVKTAINQFLAKSTKDSFPWYSIIDEKRRKFITDDPHCLSKLDGKVVKAVNGTLVTSSIPGENLSSRNYNPEIPYAGRRISNDELKLIAQNIEEQEADLNARYKDRMALDVDSALAPQTNRNLKDLGVDDVSTPWMPNKKTAWQSDFDQRDSDARFNAE